MTTLTRQPSRLSTVASFFKSFTRTSAAAPAPAMFESLEGRQMLAGGIFFFTATTKVADRTFIDNSGNKVVFTLAGPGLGTLVQDDLGNFDTLELDGTSSTKSSLTITVTKGKDSIIASTLIGNIEINDTEANDGGLIALNGAKVDLNDGLFADGTIRTLVLNNIGDGEGQAGIRIGGTAENKITLTLGLITDTLITSTSSVTAFRAVDWKDTNDTIDAFEVTNVSSITITGRAANPGTKADKINGDLQADIGVFYVPPMGSKIVPILSSLSVAGSAKGNWDFRYTKPANIDIKGDVSDSTWSNEAGFGAINIGGTTTNLTINTTKNIDSIRGGSFNHVSVTTVEGGTFGNIGTIGSITVFDWNQGHIYSGKIASLTTTGKAETKITAPIAGDFSASMLIIGVSERPGAITMGPIRIQGSAFGFKAGDEDADWHFVGGTSPIVIRGDMHDLDVQVDTKGDTKSNIGNIASLQVIGAVNNVNVYISGKIGPVDIGSADMFNLTADSTFKLGSVGTYTSKGAVNHSKILTSGTLGQVRIASADGFSVDAKGNITGFVSTGAVKNSLVEAGANVGAVNIGSADEFDIHITGNLATYISKGSVLNSAIDGVASGNVGPVNVASATHFDIHSHGNIASFVSKGDVISSTIGALGTIGAVTIAGKLDDSMVNIKGKSAGVITVASVINTGVFIGSLLDEPLLAMPTKLSQFKNFGTGTAKVYSTLAGFIVTGKGVEGNSFINSRVAAGTLNNVSLKLIDGAEPLDNGFAAGVRIGSYVRYTGPTPAGAVRVNNKTTPGTYDPTGDITGIVGYKLTIVAPILGGAAL